VKISSSNGNALEISVVGYQFPESDDPARRYSWHMVRGTATVPDASWHFRGPALTCDEAQRVAPWLRSRAAEVSDGPAPNPGEPPSLRFTEPNLALVGLNVLPGRLMLRVELDMEFHRDRAHWWAGEPYVLDLDVTGALLTDAADQWEQEIAQYPDKSSRA
jgi:hypothetical protein